MIVTTLDTFTSLLAGSTIFAILGNLAHEMGIDDITNVVAGGPGLAFVSYPEAIARFDAVPQVLRHFMYTYRIEVLFVYLFIYFWFIQRRS